MNERIIALRKYLGLTMEEFGQRLGVTRSAISNIESGKRNLTTQMVLAVCREFSVNEDWLRNGNGKMFVDGPEDEIDSLARNYGLSPDYALLIKRIVKLPPKVRDAAIEFLGAVADAFAKTDSEPVNGLTDIDIDAAVEDYRRQLEEQKKVEEKSSASNGGAQNEKEAG